MQLLVWGFFLLHQNSFQNFYPTKSVKNKPILNQGQIHCAFKFNTHLLKCLKHLTMCVCTADLSSSSLGRLQSDSDGFRLLWQLQHHGLPHRLRNALPGGQLQLPHGAYARWDALLREGVMRSWCQWFKDVKVIDACGSLAPGDAPYCTPELYKECADPALGKQQGLWTLLTRLIKEAFLTRSRGISWHF